MGLAQIAARQHGVVSTAQLAQLGISRTTVNRWVKRKRLHRLHRGVYAVGHTAPSEARSFMAAVLVCGEGAALSQVSAAVLWKFLKPQGGPRLPLAPRKSQAEFLKHRLNLPTDRTRSDLERDFLRFFTQQKPISSTTTAAPRPSTKTTSATWTSASRATRCGATPKS